MIKEAKFLLDRQAIHPAAFLWLRAQSGPRSRRFLQLED
jgi:hypothetical protein